MEIVLEDRLKTFAEVHPGTLLALASAGAPRYGLRLIAHELNAPGGPGFVNFLALSDAGDFALGRLSFVDPRTPVVEIAGAAIMPILDYAVRLDPFARADIGDIEIRGPDIFFLAVVGGHEHLERHVDLRSGHVAILGAEQHGDHSAANPALVKRWALLRTGGAARERECLYQR